MHAQLILAALALTTDGITTLCKATVGKNDYELAIAANTEYDGGYRLTQRYNGAYPTVSEDIGNARVTAVAGRVLTIQLEPKGYIFDPDSLNIPFFDTVLHRNETGTIDLTDPLHSTASLRGVTLECL
jgi:hypothetical protein